MSSASEFTGTLLQKGLEQTHARRFGEAGQLFLQALEQVESWPDGAERSHMLGTTADRCSLAGHPDIALMALGALLESSNAGQSQRYTADLLTLANSWNRLGRLNASARVNELALGCALERDQSADAASASTNLAMLDANEGYLSRALGRLQKSLELLKKESNPHTDAITRFALIWVVDAMEADPEIALTPAAALFTGLLEYVDDQRWGAVAPAFQRLVDRYLAAHPELNSEDWKREKFPRVFGEDSK
jgi:tetratricopeptide (TPR) repeat protein